MKLRGHEMDERTIVHTIAIVGLGLNALTEETYGVKFWYLRQLEIAIQFVLHG